METKTITQVIEFDALPHEIFNALIESKRHTEFTGSRAHIDPTVGGLFSVWDGYATGKTIEIKPDHKIVQEWRATDWPEGHVSTVTFDMRKTDAGTELHFTQVGVPEDLLADTEKGWNEYYWEPLKEYLR